MITAVHILVLILCVFFFLMGSYSLYSLIMDFFMEYRGKHLFFFFLIYLFIFMAVLGLRFCARAFSSCGKRGPLFIAVRGPLTIAASLVAEHRLQTRRLSTCGSRAQLLCGMWDLPRPGLEPVSPALAGRFSTTAPPGKPNISSYHYLFIYNRILKVMAHRLYLACSLIL